jgi:hypothetical protein
MGQKRRFVVFRKGSSPACRRRFLKKIPAASMFSREDRTGGNCGSRSEELKKTGL